MKRTGAICRWSLTHIVPRRSAAGILAGVDNFEHTGLAAAPEYPDDIIKAIRERAANMAMGPLFWTPTIEGLFNYEYIRDNPEHIDDSAWHEGLPQDHRRRHQAVADASGAARLLPRHAVAAADAGAQVQPAARGRRDAARSAPTAASR